ncbi:adenylyltransferase and sulfurtransferase MOCS3-like [Vespa mandarinia]|uniref:adenylyltransferase and sulfurtransferase MOCS3-like n=1 Tax=Vespa mandarinia TaxID=7446 RepID=UPI0016200A53|nr:adenylyltransferase and sulfurtransferase MOCS3-like [Vespa mandarinia]XP_046816479.1 adenylyltransferase and sulfurtransferase MOCS3 [Vespa crabro]XP_047346406.1 adenylyltransferase and sulfurtransferase MOCS3 [Vespa velutina]XP_047346408.1 adenylyltransferase and sulfurtransferase MOCS3 [Vespa velutina]
MEEEELINEIAKLRELLHEKESELANIRRAKQIPRDHGLNNDEISRYSRQIFLPEIGVTGQKKIKESSVLIVGVGGLGCPSALYLTCSGIGRIGLVDYDNIEINNLHRQVLFTEGSIGMPKVTVAAEFLNKLNSYTEVTPYKLQLDSSNALKIIELYDIVLDATDNVATRYLLNDACVLSNKPLISGSALRFEGHLSVFNYKGPCYRCIFPKPPSPETVTNCGDGGVLGAAVGTIGVLQAVEAIKVILDMPETLSGRLLVFDGIETRFRNINLRTRNQECAICGKNPIIKELIDYEQFCGAKANDKNPNLNLLKNEDRITVETYNHIIKFNTEDHLLIDVRSPEEFQICRLRNSINIPLYEIYKDNATKQIKSEIDKQDNGKTISKVYVLCRRGNDSQKAVKHLQEIFKDSKLNIKDIIGGIHAWSNKIDSTFPIY